MDWFNSMENWSKDKNNENYKFQGIAYSKGLIIPINSLPLNKKKKKVAKLLICICLPRSIIFELDLDGMLNSCWSLRGCFPFYTIYSDGVVDV